MHSKLKLHMPNNREIITAKKRLSVAHNTTDKSHIKKNKNYDLSRELFARSSSISFQNLLNLIKLLICVFSIGK